MKDQSLSILKRIIKSFGRQAAPPPGKVFRPKRGKGSYRRFSAADRSKLLVNIWDELDEEF